MTEQDEAYPIGEEDRQRYANVLTEIRVRMDQAGIFLDQQPASHFTIDSAAVQIRKSIELVALGSLVTNRAYVESASSAFQKKDWTEARKLVKSKNPKYWPEPTQKEQRAAGQYELDDVSEPYLAEHEAGREYGFLSDLLHATNPYQSHPDPPTAHARLCDLHRRLVALLNHHVVNLVDTDYMAIGQMHVVPSGGVQVAIFRRLDQPPSGS